jgi:HEAT repeat protein
MPVADRAQSPQAARSSNETSPLNHAHTRLRESARDGATPAEKAPVRRGEPLNPEPGGAAPQRDASRLTESASRLRDSSIPVEERRAEIASLAERGDEPSVRVLMDLGDDHTYLNWAAVEALGRTGSNEVIRYLRGKLTHPDPRVLCSAVKGLARAAGTASVRDVAEVLERNRERPDGCEDMVCSTCVGALGEIGSAKAIPALRRELEGTVGTSLHYEYGSAVVAALRAIGDSAAGPVLAAYARRLARAREEMSDNPLGREYMEAKISEALGAAEAVR